MNNTARKGSTPVMGSLQNNRAKPYDFLMGDLIRESWVRVNGAKAAYWGAIGLLFLINIGLALIGAILGYLLTAFVGGKSGIAIQDVCLVVVWFIDMPLFVGLFLLSMRRSVDLPIEAKQIFTMFDYFWQIIGLEILILLVVYGVGIAGGFLIGIFSGVITASLGMEPNWAIIIMEVFGVFLVMAMLYFAMAFMFSPLLIVEKGFGIIQAMKTSFRAFNQHWFKIIVTYFIFIGIYLISAIPLLIGLIWTLPMMLNFLGILYRIAFGVEEARKF